MFMIMIIIMIMMIKFINRRSITEIRQLLAILWHFPTFHVHLKRNNYRSKIEYSIWQCDTVPYYISGSLKRKLRNVIDVIDDWGLLL